MEARKANKVIRIEAAEADSYKKRGYDIYEDGKKVADGVGKTVAYAKYAALEEELEALKAELGKKAPAKQAKAETAEADKTVTAKK